MTAVSSTNVRLHTHSRHPAGRDSGGVLVRVLPVAAVLCIVVGGCRCPNRGQSTPPEAKAHAEPPQTPAASLAPAPAEAKAQPEPFVKLGEPVSLFDGQTLGQWKITDFGGQGDVSVKDGAIYLGMGNYMTGVTWSGPVVRMSYEISLEAMRVEGSDFFCGLTFPVAENPCTLILGGWGGSVCGLSSLDRYDASENETTRMMSFEKGKWYKVRLRVVPNRIQAWLDDESLVDVDITGRRVDIRIEVDLSQPLGIATYATTGAIRNIRLTRLPEQAR